MSPIYIFDLDGTLALIDHRRPLVSGDNKDWPAFFAACVDDHPYIQVITTFQLLQETGAEIWIWSGRSDAVANQTVEWLSRHEVFADRLRMRPATDHRPDEVLKAEWLDSLTFYERERIVAIFEDRDRMVNLWRSRGIACFQVAPGNF